MGKHAVRACLIVNPRSGGGGVDLSDALLVLAANRWEVEIRQKLHKGYAVKLAREAAREGFDVVVACGGDGTVSEVIDGLAGTDVAVGTLPAGTENVWSREIGVSSRLRVAATQLVGAERLKVDVGYTQINGHHAQHFLLMAGLGLDGAVMARVSRTVKNKIGPLAVGMAMAEALPSFRSVPIRAEIDGVHWQGRITQLVVGNTRRYGGFTRMTADAYIDDGLLDVCFITTGGAVDATRQAASLILRQRPSDGSAETYRVKKLTVVAPTVMPFQLDGGAIEQDEIDVKSDGVVYEFSVLPRAVTVLVPKTYDGELLESGSLRASEHSLNGKAGKGKHKKHKKG
jgi:YegS/Rv2252/BmrU family lipid kinase